MGLFHIHRRNTPERQGKIGENQAYSVIKSYHSSRGRFLRVIRDYRYYTTTSHQVDFVVVNSSGIFIVEVKNWPGVIRGGFNDSMWEFIKRGVRHPMHYKNPIQQNIAHLRSFKAIYKGHFPVYSLVVVASNNKPANVPGIRNLRELPAYFEENGAKKYNQAMVNQEYNYILSLKKNISDREHLRNIQTIKNERNARIKQAQKSKRY